MSEVNGNKELVKEKENAIKVILPDLMDIKLFRQARKYDKERI